MIQNTCFRCSPKYGVNLKHDCVNECRCFLTVLTCSFTLELKMKMNEEEMLSVFSTALVADVGFGRCLLFYQIKLVLINSMYRFCSFLHRCNGLCLKVAHGLRFHFHQHGNFFASLSFVTVSERSSHWRCSSKPLYHKLLSWTFVLKIYERHLGRSSIIL